MRTQEEKDEYIRKILMESCSLPTKPQKKEPVLKMYHPTEKKEEELPLPAWANRSMLEIDPALKERVRRNPVRAMLGSDSVWGDGSYFD